MERNLSEYRDMELVIPERRARQHHDRHHASFSQVIHDDPFNKAIREHPNNIYPILREHHEELHRNVIYTPPFPYQVATRVLKNLHMGIDAEDKIDIYIDAVETAVRHPRATRLDTQLASLAINSILAQAPYLIQGEYRREI